MEKPTIDPIQNLKEGLNQVWRNKTNQEIADDNFFHEWCASQEIEPTKRQASRHREKFLEWLESEDVEEIKKPETPKVELKIVKPHADKNFMIAFEGKTELECAAYSAAIDRVLKKAEMKPFHQVGVTQKGTNIPGYHAWEVWRNVKEEEITALFPKIEKEAQLNFKDFEGLYKD